MTPTRQPDQARTIYLSHAGPSAGPGHLRQHRHLLGPPAPTEQVLFDGRPHPSPSASIPNRSAIVWYDPDRGIAQGWELPEPSE